MRHARWIGCWQPGQRCGRCCCCCCCCCDSGSMSPRQMGQGGMAGGVVAPGCVQSWSVVRISSMGPPSSSVRSTREMFWLFMLTRKGRSATRGGDREIQRRPLKLYWPASRYAVVSRCFFLFCFDLSFLFCLRKRWAKCLLIRPVVTRLFFTLASLQVSKWRVFRVGRLHHRPVLWKCQTTKRLTK